MPDTPNYMESTVAAKEWIRCGEVTIHNPHGGTPSMYMREQKVILYDNDTAKFTLDAGGLMVSFDETNPLHMQLYEVCNAIYIEERNKRDGVVV